MEFTLDTTVGNLNKKEEKLAVDSFLEPTFAAMELFTFLLNWNHSMLINLIRSTLHASCIYDRNDRLALPHLSSHVRT